MTESNRAIRRAVFSAILRHYGMDEADDDDQNDASDLAKAIMTEVDPEVERARRLAWDEGFQARTLMAYGVAGPQRNPYLAAEQPEGAPRAHHAPEGRT